MTNKKKEIDYRIVITGILCITALEMFAMFQGINGWLLRAVVVGIAAAIGFVIPFPKSVKFK